MTKSLDLAKLLPKRYRDKTIDSLIGNLFNQHLTKPDTETFYGYVGSKAGSSVADIYVDEPDLERQINQLVPALYVKSATDQDVMTWADVVQRMALLGVDYNTLADWFKVGTHNFVPPIDIDKFTNYAEYLWVGGWIREDSGLPYELLGVPAGAAALSMGTTNPSFDPDYYVVQRGQLSGTTPIPPQPGMTTWSPWALGNLWVHKNDALSFYNTYGASLDFNSAQVAKRPIIEVFSDVKLNSFIDSNFAPSDSGTARAQAKVRTNQPVQLDLYYHTGDHAGLISAGFFYSESPDASIDPVLDRRVVVDGEDFVFAHGFVHPLDGRLLWFKRYDGSKYDLHNMWTLNSPAEGVTDVLAAQYKKYSTVGTVINLDKFDNYTNYFWTDDSTPPQYSVIASGSSGWTTQNSWKHVAELSHEQQLASIPAARPIIEFNGALTNELLEPKVELGQLPRFKTYIEADGAMHEPSYDAAVTDTYTRGLLFARLADLDPVIQRAILTSSELISRLVTVKGELYVQSFVNGAYRRERDGAVYGYTLRELSRTHTDVTPVVWSSTERSTALGGDATLSADGLSVSSVNDGSTASPSVRSNLGFSVGKRYFEVRVDAISSSGPSSVSAGIALSTWLPSLNDQAYGIGYTRGGVDDSWGITAAGDKVPTWEVNFTQLLSAGGYMMFAVDIDSGRVWFGANGMWRGDPSAGVAESFSFTPGATVYAGATVFGDGVNPGSCTANFGGSAFAYPVPTGFTAFDGSTPGQTSTPGNGTLALVSDSTNVSPRIVKMVATTPNTFAVSTYNGTPAGTLHVGSPVAFFGVQMIMTQGTVPFSAGDMLLVEIKSVIYDPINLYCKLEDEFKSFSAPEGILTDDSIDRLALADPALREGVWVAHPALGQNLNAENGTTFKQSDLITHFASIIDSQPGISGNAYGRNTWRELSTHSYTLGGTIKQIDQRLQLLLSTLMQTGMTPVTLLETSKLAYDQMLSRVREYVEERLIDDLIDGTATVAGVTVDINDATVKKLIAYLEGVEFEGDLGVGRPFFDTTMPIKALTLTGPYLGLQPPTEPGVVYDNELNLYSVQHHDGHLTPYPTIDDKVLKRLVSKLYNRSTGQVTPGVISGPNPPQKPFAKQLWLDLSSMTLFVFDAISDSGERSSVAPYGSFSYDRLTGEVWEFDGVVWTSLGDSQLTQDSCWRPVDLAKSLTQLLVAVEQKLFASCPQLSLVDPAPYEAKPLYASMMRNEFESFASRHGILDPYSPQYDSTNPFTWNYVNNGSNPAAASWQDVYSTAYGTTRPDLYPWIAIGLTKSGFLANMIAGGYLPVGTTTFEQSMWPSVATVIKSLLVGLGLPIAKPGALSVDTTTGSLLPPHALGAAEQLLDTAPSSPDARFLFGQGGPVELLWTRTTDYALAKHRTYYRLDPLTFTERLWGDDFVRVNGYGILESTGLKPTIADVLLHGTVSSGSGSDFVTAAAVNVLPVTDMTVVITVARSDEVSVSIDGASAFVTALDGPGSTTSYSGNGISFTIQRPLEGLQIGSKCTIVFDYLGGIKSMKHEFLPYKASSGLGQVLVHSLRREGIDAALTQVFERLTTWEPRLAYRFGSLIDTQSLVVKVNDEQVTESSVTILRDEVKHKSSRWYSALRVTLHRRGAATRSGQVMVPALSPVTDRRGDDWAFRIDVLNTKAPYLEWYELGGESDAFMAMGGRRSTDEWKRFKTKGVLRQVKGPFLVTGIQNLVTFLFGVADRLHDLGYRPGGVNELIVDSTNRRLDYQYLIEQVIDMAFAGASEGAGAVLNPFADELAFWTDYGVVSSFSDSVTDESLTPMLLDASSKRLKPGSYRVFRQDELTTANFDTPVYGIHTMTSVYEHVMLLPYTDGAKLLFSPLLGQQAPRVFVTGERQRTKHGRPFFAGKYSVGDEMRENIEASVVALQNLFDSGQLTASTDRAERVRAMLGFSEADYFAQRGTSPASEFRFWQGLLSSKGTNAALDAYINSRSFTSAYLDEFWAYKVATYGDGRPVTDVDLKVRTEDFTAEHANFLLLEEDELELEKYKQDGGLDIQGYDDIPFDNAAVTTVESVLGLPLDHMELRGCILVRPDDPDRWYRYSDVGQLRYLEADKFVDVQLAVEAINRPYRLTMPNGEPVRADVMEVILPNVPFDGGAGDQASLQLTYREEGDYVLGSNPARYTAPKFRRLNQSSIQIDDFHLIGKTVTVRCYGPGLSKFTPARLYRYKPDVTQVADDIIWWDPARGCHHPEAFAHVDFTVKRDPSVYTDSLLKGDGVSVNPRRPWGPEQVGKVWWDVSKTEWLPYSDTKLFPQLNERLARWGGIAEYADLKLYEWVESTVAPTDYAKQVENGAATGSVGLSRYIYRDRTWQQRPVAWLYSSNPQQQDHAAIAYQTTRLTTETVGADEYLVSWDGALPRELDSGVKVAAASYSNSTRLPSQLVKPLGQLLIGDGKVKLLLGSSTSASAPAFAAITAAFTNMTVRLNESTLTSLSSARGAVALSSETVGGVVYARATFTETGLTQAIVIEDTPANDGTPYELVFDNLGVSVASTVTWGTGSAWTPAASTSADRIARVAAELCSTSHDLSVREARPVQVQVPTGLAHLPGVEDSGLNGWIAWKDPTNVSVDNLPPRNKWAPLFGDWVDVDTRLAELVDDIKDRSTDPWTLKTGETVDPYQSVWTRWKLLKDKVNEGMYYTGPWLHLDMCKSLGFSSLDAGEIDRARVYVNGVETTDFTTAVDGANSYVVLPKLAQGDAVYVKIPAYVPTSDELKTDLTDPKADPSALREYKLDAPYVTVVERNDQGRIINTRYFFWVTGKEDQPINKQMSTLMAERLLRAHDGAYAVPQVIKYYNQVDGRPNRYALFSLKGVGHMVGADETYRVRIVRDPGMRADSEDNHLKTRHTEWSLIRPNQPTRIPKELWDKLVDTLCGETALGDPLPYVQLYEHDLRSAVKSSYGLGDGQVLTDRDEARATVIGTMRNTRVVKYDSDAESFVPDPISYDGFDLSAAEQRLSTPASTRAFMGELWLNAKPKQLNELFFAVLEDALVKTTELNGIFKTSYIALGEVRTVIDESTASETIVLHMQGPTVTHATANNVSLEQGDNTDFILCEDGSELVTE